jgi:transcriptional regulator NrdR family protein
VIALNKDHAARDEAFADMGDDLWACPMCGKKDWRVTDSRFDGMQRRRQRVCRKCHTSLPTIELPQPKGFRVVVVMISEDAL